jgi:phosphoadenosine phosphosulfate reductase
VSRLIIMSESTLAPLEIAKLDLNYLNRKFEKSDPKRILAWCVANLPSPLVQVSNFNIDDLVITDLLYRRLNIVDPIPVLFINTLHHFPETLQIVAYTQAHYHLNLKVYRVLGANSEENFATKYGNNLWNQDLKKYQYLTQIEPLERGLNELKPKAWISNRRRHSCTDNDDLTIFEWDNQARLKINPLAYWTRTESWAYTFEHDLVYHPLHDEGYTDIGDRPLTHKNSDSCHPFSRLW